MKTAVILFNLGGPDSLDAVEPFLFNLFRDPAIIALPNPLRWMIAKFISRKRAPEACGIYQKLGGKSPLLEQTRKQADGLSERLGNENEIRVWVSMRYWHPMSHEVAEEVKAYAPDRIMLVPLYPQFSTTTSRSSVRDWKAQAAKVGLTAPTSAICCYPTMDGFVAAMAKGTKAAVDKLADQGPTRVLFSAHGLPKKIVDRGDPYPMQVERSALAIATKAALEPDSWRVSYQSRVGPLEWIGPYTDDEIKSAGRVGLNLVIVPLAFVSEHSETLVELDMDYRDLAAESGVTHYERVMTVRDDPLFLDGLATMIRNTTGNPARDWLCGSDDQVDVCHGACPCKNA